MSTAADAGRLAWVDVAKGLAIVLVVLHHGVIFTDAVGWLPAGVVAVNEELAAFRMPLFFLASGLFAASALARPWRVVVDRRLLPWVYLYVLWFFIRWLFFVVVPDVRGGAEVGGVRELLRLLVMPESGLWFIYALACFTVLAKVTRRVPLLLQLAPAAAVSALVTSGVLDIDTWGWRGMGAYYVFFLAGMHCSAAIRGWAARATWSAAAALGAGAVACTLAIRGAGLADVPGVLVAQAVLAVAFGVTLAVMLAQSPTGAVLQRLGGKTLPIYLFHVLWVAGLVAALDAVMSPSGPLGVVILLALTVTGIAVSLAAQDIAGRARAGWLFELPSGRARATAPSVRPAAPVSR